jgi:putative ABC transport system permease protein
MTRESWRRDKSSSEAPPRLARSLLALLLPARIRGHQIGDLDDEFRLRVTEGGVGRDQAVVAARRWYRRQVARSLAPAIACRVRDLQPPSFPTGRKEHALDLLVQDFRFGLRSLRRAPGFAAPTILMLGLGIGATTTFFSVANGVLLRALPYPQPERLVSVREYLIERGVPGPGSPGQGVSYPDVLDLRRDTDVFESIAAVNSETYLLLGAGEPVDVRASVAEPELFQLFGIPAALGRTLRVDDRDAVVLSDSIWRTHFGADPQVVGKSISLDREPFVVVGVMPPDFLPRSGPLWVPFSETPSDELEDRRSKWLFYAYARLAAGVSIEQARAAMRLSAETLAVEYPETNEGWGIWVSPLHAETIRNAGDTLWLLLGASGVLLLIACANVANLQLARLSARRRETAIRGALGAGRRRIAVQLMVESLTMGLAGGAAGALLSVWGVRTFVALSPGGIPRLDGVGVDGAALAFTLLVAIITGVLFGLVPAIRGSGSGLLSTLRQGERGSGSGTAARRLRSGLLVGEVALAVILLAGAGLMVHSYLYLWTYEPGFDPSDTLSFHIGLDRTRYPQAEHQAAFYQRLYERLRALPQVEAVGGVARLPGAGRGGDALFPFIAEGAAELAADEELLLRMRPFSGDLLEALDIPVLAGRPLASDGAPQLLLNRTAVEMIWPGSLAAEAIGRQVRFFPQDPTPWHEVVGVVGDIRYDGLDPQPRPEVYLPHSSEHFRGRFGGAYVIMRTSGDPAALIPAAREAVWAIDSEQPIEQIATLEAALAESMARPRFYTFLFSVFGGLALVLSAAGVFGLAAYSVAQRTHEIAVRMALGAQPGAVLWMVLRQGMGAITLGVGIGLLATRWLGRFVEGFLYGTRPTDPLTLAFVCATLGVVALVALALPARRATRVDPVRVLQEE